MNFRELEKIVADGWILKKLKAHIITMYTK